MSATVYRAYSADDELLYVGATTQPGQRLAAHGRSKDWWREVATIKLAHFPSPALAQAAEREAIQNENPRYNLSRPGRPVDAETIERRRLAREARDEELRRQSEAAWFTNRRVRCANCGARPSTLPKGELLDDLDCPTCGVPGLELSAS